MSHKNVDSLTLAYVVMGAHAVLREFFLVGGSLEDTGLDEECAFIETIIERVPILEATRARLEPECLFLYDVAEPYGGQVAQALLDGECDDDACQQLATALMEEFLPEVEDSV